MPGVTPKPAEARRRRNVQVTAAKIAAPVLEVIPELPARGRKKWHTFTLAWWKSVQTCEMRNEYLESDLHGLYILADMIDTYWKATRGKASLAAEVRQQAMRYGLSPIDRRRLQWNIDRSKVEEEAPPGITALADFRREMQG